MPSSAPIVSIAFADFEIAASDVSIALASPSCLAAMPSSVASARFWRAVQIIVVGVGEVGRWLQSLELGQDRPTCAEKLFEVLDQVLVLLRIPKLQIHVTHCLGASDAPRFRLCGEILAATVARVVVTACRDSAGEGEDSDGDDELSHRPTVHPTGSVRPLPSRENMPRMSDTQETTKDLTDRMLSCPIHEVRVSEWPSWDEGPSPQALQAHPQRMPCPLDGQDHRVARRGRILVGDQGG